jgi:hypothetical protein
MATRKGKTSAGTAMAVWEEELAKQALIAAGMEDSTATGQFFGLRSGVLTWNDAPMPGNQMAVIIVDSVLENVFYDGKFDPDAPQSPICFAFGREEKTMEPHKAVFESGNEQCGESGSCAGCELNSWGSADVGRGKACRNTRRLAMIPAGKFSTTGKFELIDDDEHFEKAQIGFMKLPVTSVKGYAAFVKQIAGALRRPPHGIVTKISVVPDAKSQFRVIFEPLINIPNELMGIIMERHNEAMNVIDFPYTPNEEEVAPPPPPPPKRSRGKAAPVEAPAATGRGRGKAAEAPKTSRKY